VPDAELQQFLDDHDARLDDVIARFATYQPQPINHGKLVTWLGQFDAGHRDLLLRTLEEVHYYDTARINALVKELHGAVRNQLKDDGIRNLKHIVFAPAGGAGESGQEIFRRYRDVNKLEQTTATIALVPELQQLVYNAQNHKQPIAVVLVDDFIGSGNQLSAYWDEVLKQLIPPPLPPLYVASLAACDKGIQVVHASTPLRVITVHYLPANAFLQESPNFNDEEKEIIRNYCLAVGNQPAGWGGLELLLAFTYGCPDNTLSVFRGSQRQRTWRGILPRFSDL
jgi:hypothetical protein